MAYNSHQPMSAITRNLDEERFQRAVRETYPDRNHLQQILSTVRKQLENGEPILSEVVLQLLDRDPHTGMYTCSWHENATLCRWLGSQRASRAEAHINNHLERRPYICDGTQCGSNNCHAAFYSSEDLYAHQTRGGHVPCSKCGKGITAQNMNRHQSSSACS